MSSLLESEPVTCRGGRLNVRQWVGLGDGDEDEIFTRYQLIGDG